MRRPLATLAVFLVASCSYTTSRPVVGSDGPDRLEGSPASDQLDGREGADILSGGDGDDVIDGGPGVDVMVGGPGADTFVFSPEDLSEVPDRITDYRAEEGDRIEMRQFDQLARAAINSLVLDAGVLKVRAQLGGNVLIPVVEVGRVRRVRV